MKSIITIIIIIDAILRRSSERNLSRVVLSFLAKGKGKKEKKRLAEISLANEEIFSLLHRLSNVRTKKWQKARSYTCLSFFCTALSTRVYTLPTDRY